MSFIKSFYLTFLLIFIFKLLPSFYCKGVCSSMGLIDVGDPVNGGCSNGAQLINNHCCGNSPCIKKGMEDTGRRGMQGNCDGGATYVEGRCCKKKEQKQVTSKPLNEIEIRT
ncbi:unnamed protein product [Meloidogyne enterolobii]|uniref:Uncharacterized protein n=1 Tax=Meloidogyne enterolobii TaxID=390850 RepID=A0ACB1A0V2_MELEN